MKEIWDFCYDIEQYVRRNSRRYFVGMGWIGTKKKKIKIKQKQEKEKYQTVHASFCEHSTREGQISSHHYLQLLDLQVSAKQTKHKEKED